uniref:Uncharacterized protein n=1 Tax=uncultured bacterium contig00010 TaxID=1181502 RepID=A0A806KFM2_9BACT|nr:hypothetical protein [uncultured bacterium contig00010]
MARNKKLGRELNLKRTDFEAVGTIKNCLVRMYDGSNIKVLEIISPVMDDDDKQEIIKKLENKALKKYDWLKDGVRIIFPEMIKPYSINKIKDILDELVAYFENKYPNHKPKCPKCELEKDLDLYYVNNNAYSICNDCYEKMEAEINEVNIKLQDIPENYFSGFIGVLLFSVIGILITIMLFMIMKTLAVFSALAYGILGIVGYTKFKGKMSPTGAKIIIVTGLLMIPAGIIISFFILFVKETNIMNIYEFLNTLSIPEVNKEIIQIMSYSFLIGIPVSIFLYLQMINTWKTKIIIKKGRKI